MRPSTAEIVPPELLEEPSARDRRRLDASDCAFLLDPLLRRLARQEALCRRVLGRLARPFLLRRAHQRLGFTRLDDYARERLGISGLELQDLGRVTERLEVLPAVARAFAAGALSWSHIRVIAAAATPDTEASWLARARTTTVRDLAGPAAADSDDEAIDGE